MDCPRAEVEDYLHRTHSDPLREEELDEQGNLMNLEVPASELDMAEPSIKEVTAVLKKARAASAPGPNGIPYKVYKNCPRLARLLWKLIKVIWRRGRLPEEWLKAEGCFIPKEEDSQELKQFRPISMLKVREKMLGCPGQEDHKLYAAKQVH